MENVKTLNCYYARSGVDDLKRRSYWRLEVPAGEATYALVHYLHAEGKAGTGPVRYGGGAFALSDESEEDDDEGARRRRRGRAGALPRRPPGCGAPDPPPPHQLQRLQQYMNVQIAAGGPAMVAPTSGMGSSLPFGGSGGLPAIAVSQLPSLPGFAPGLSLMPGLSSMLDPMLLSQLSLMQSQVAAGGGGGGDGPVVALPGAPDAAGLSPMWTSSLPPGYDFATAAALGSLQQQLASAPGGVDVLMQQATLEAAARSAALQRPQPGTLFSSGQLVAQQMAAAQQAQQAAQLAAAQQVQLAAQQQAAAQQHTQLAVAQAQLAALTEQKALAAQVVAQLQQVAEESSGLMAATGSGGLAAAPSGGSTAGAALQPSGSMAVSAAGSQQGASAQQPQQQSAAEVNEQYAVAPMPPSDSGSRPGGGRGAEAASGGGSPPTAASARERLLRSQASFNDECMQRVLFHQMSLGLREGPEFAAQLAAALGPPGSPEPGLEGGAGAPAVGAAAPVPSSSGLAALLASPPRLRRGLSRNSSGIPRFTSFDARDDLGGLLASQARPPCGLPLLPSLLRRLHERCGTLPPNTVKSCCLLPCTDAPLPLTPCSCSSTRTSTPCLKGRPPT